MSNTIFTNIEPNSIDWFNERKKYIGASEIPSLVKYFYTDNELSGFIGNELTQNLDLKNTNFYNAGFVILQSKINNIHVPRILLPEVSEWGIGAESVGKEYLIESKGFDKSKIKDSTFITNPSINDWVGCTPDLIYDNNIPIEMKTVNSFSGMEGQEISSYWYLQVMYQMLTLQSEKGYILKISLNRDFEKPYYRGKLVAELEHLGATTFYKKYADVISFDLIEVEYNQKIANLFLKILEYVKAIQSSGSEIPSQETDTLTDYELKSIIDFYSYSDLANIANRELTINKVEEDLNHNHIIKIAQDLQETKAHLSAFKKDEGRFVLELKKFLFDNYANCLNLPDGSKVNLVVGRKGFTLKIK